MIECGAFAGPNHKPVELIRGELRMISPQGAEHAELIAQLNDSSHDTVDHRRIKIRIQPSVEIPTLNTQPEPDIVGAEYKSYARCQPEPHEILLLLKVADSSLSFDLREKCKLYAESGTRDCCVFDIPNWLVHIFAT